MKVQIQGSFLSQVSSICILGACELEKICLTFLFLDIQADFFETNSTDAINGGAGNAAITEAWLGDKGMEIKKQITGMMRLLNDKAGRVYHRVGQEGETLKQEPQDLELSWSQPVASSTEDPQHSAWSAEPIPRPQGSVQYGTRSKTLRMLTDTKNSVKANEVATPLSSTTEPGCCMCTCKSTLQAILQELRAVKKLMQTQKVRSSLASGSQEKQRVQGNVSPVRCPAPKKRPCRRRPVHRVATPVAPCRRPPLPSCATAEPTGRKERPLRERPTSSQSDQTSQLAALPTPAEDTLPQHSLVMDPPSSEPEVRLADDYEVYIPKSQLDSILVNYTRSGSLLFRKLVCAFFDDTTLANSLPNGKRKRGLNDNRKGLDQNIVGAIKVFTEKYCSANRIEKLPGPRDWVQILQDQIKLARRRLKRGNEAEAADCDTIFKKASLCTAGRDSGRTAAAPEKDVDG
ncbi:BEN domain-containing protein 7-like isoform X3 [Scleropages formosus]|uniref:BEN domain-containing protein 7-like isoform X3 n=1 Tax=Scleropages formosus TaxID=113540 RepID=UPI0010FA9FE8|nr:BEN domain-containing protein 7-like isoform X3 [Scleropages formosus]